MDSEKQKRQQTLEDLFNDAVFSGKFKQYTARFVLPPFAAGSLGLAAGCAGFNPSRESACDPMYVQRHDKHVEQGGFGTTQSSSSARTIAVSTNTLSSTAVHAILANSRGRSS